MTEPLKVKQKKRITDEFVIGVGEDCTLLGTPSRYPREEQGGRTQSGFICSSTRKGAIMPEPFDDHRIGEWIIGEFRLNHFKKYRVKVTVTMLGEVEKETATK